MLTKQKLIYQIKHHPVIRAAYEKLGSAALTIFDEPEAGIDLWKELFRQSLRHFPVLAEP